MHEEKRLILLEDRLKEIVVSQKLWKKQDHLFLACSGGVDSVVLAHVMHSAGFSFELLHCNFNLRGEESMRDEDFVRKLAAELQVGVFVKSFDTKKEMALLGMGVQEAARKLRYDWFSAMIDAKIKDGKSALLLTAHHLDDQVETIAMNFFRGTGIAGIRGMNSKLNHVVRPLLSISRKELIDYATLHGLTWAEDSSNKDVHYTRNLFRHSILPAVRKVFPAIDSNLIANAKRFTEIEFLYRKQVDKIKAGLIEKNQSGFSIPVKKLMLAEPLDTIMFEIFNSFGFSVDQCMEIKKLFLSSSGKSMQSASHRVLKNRDWLLIDEIQISENKIVIIEEGDELVNFGNQQLEISYKTARDEGRGTGDKEYKNTARELNTARDEGRGTGDKGTALTASIDINEISFPLILRQWKAGDYFYPLGMKKKKKVSKFMTDIKMSKFEKEQQWVLESDKKIIWVVGKRLDDRVKIKSSTNAILFIEMLSC
jgi:tRNA(Ile)-lysidine synthase